MIKKLSSSLIYAVFIIAVFRISLHAQTFNFTLDFEDGTLRGWQKTGSAFNNQPTYGDNVRARDQGSSNLQGKYWIGTYENYQQKTGQRPGQIQGDKPQGTLTSPVFTIPKGVFNFLIGGGSSRLTRVDLVLYDQIDNVSNVIFSAVGKNSDSMQRVYFPLDQYAGRSGYILIVDSSSTHFGHIDADDFRFTPARQIDTTSVTVPDLIGLTPPAAIDRLLRIGLHIHYADSVESEMEPGTIVRQNPRAGSKAAEGDVVAVNIALPILVTVPPLLGRTVEEARRILTISKLRMGNVTSVESNSEAGKIIKQTPVRGRRIKRWDPVDVEIAVGPEKVIVPDLTGHTKDEAEGLLRENKLIPGGTTFTYQGGEPGRIVNQDPPPNEEVNIGTAVNFSIRLQKYTIALVPASTGVDSGQAAEFKAEMDPPADNVEYQFHYGDGTMSFPSGSKVTNHIYKNSGNYTAYVTASIDHRVIAQSEPVSLWVRSNPVPPIWPYIVIGAILLLGGAGAGAYSNIKSKRITRFLDKSVRLHKGSASITLNLEDTNIRPGIKLRVKAESDRTSKINFK